MTSKTILVMALAATLILSTFAFGDNAFAFIQPNELSRITTQTGTAICIDQGESCGEGKVRAKFRLLATETNGDIVQGVAQGVIQGSGWDWLVSESSSNTNVEINLDQLSFEYDSANRFLSLAGNDNEWRINAVGNVGEFKNGEAKMELNLRLVNTNTLIIVQDEILLAKVTIESNAFLQVDDKIGIKSIGHATCETSTGGDCGSGLLKSKAKLLVQEVGDSSTSGIGKIRTVMNITDGWDFEDEFRSKSLGFTYDVLNRVISISGDAKASNGSIWQLDMRVDNIDLVEKTGDCSLRYSNPNGATIKQESVLCGIIFVSVGGR